MRVLTLLCGLALFAGSAVSGTTVTVNGKMIHVPGNNVTGINGRVIVDGELERNTSVNGSGFVRQR
jgi:hypothetical protein